MTVSGRSIRMEVILLCAGSVFLAALLVGGITYDVLKQQQQLQVMHGLQTLADERATKIEDYMDTLVHHLSRIGQSDKTASAMQKLDAAFGKGIDSTDYMAADSKFRPLFKRLLEHDRYHDIYLINQHGEIVFTVAHASDFESNLSTGPYRNSGLARAWRDAIQKLSPGILQFELYKPSKPAVLAQF